MNRLKYFSVTLPTLRSHTKINKVEAIWCPFWNVILADELCLTHPRICPLGHHFPISCFNRTPKWAFVYHEFSALSCSSSLLEAPCSRTAILSSCFPHMSIIIKNPSQNTHSRSPSCKNWRMLQHWAPAALQWRGHTGTPHVAVTPHCHSEGKLCAEVGLETSAQPFILLCNFWTKRGCCDHK